MFPRNWLSQSWRWELTSLFALVAVATAGISRRTLAQIIPDTTLGAESSVVTSNVLFRGLSTEQIDGGATRGVNLFHSFEQFNVDSGRGAYFRNPNGIENILGRVTGGTPSNILGRLGVRGNANLFLINPNGIILGPNASLDINGSFVATTANAIAFGTEGFFSASASELPLVLTVNPSAFFFNQLTTGSIQSTANLQIRSDLVFVGGNISLDGGFLQAPQGRIALAGVSGAGTVELNLEGNNLSLNFPNDLALGDVSLANGAIVDASGAGGGNIQVQGRRVTLTDGSQIAATTQEAEPGGTITVIASESVEVTGVSANGQPSSISTQVNPPANQDATGAGGNLTIQTGRLIIQQGAQVSTGTFSTGDGGNLTVSASEFVQLSGTSTLANGTEVASGLFSQTQGEGAAGNLTIETGRLIVQGGAQVTASTRSEGQGGTLVVAALESVEVSGTSTAANEPTPSGVFAVAEGGSGDAGNLSIETRRLIVQDGAVVTASTFGGSQGRGGTLTVTASDSVELGGTTPNGEFPSGLLVGTEGGAAAGALSVETGQLIVRDGAVVSAATSGQGVGGDITVQADTLSLTNGARITSRSQGQANAGSIQLQAGSLSLDEGAFISAETAGGEGGNIRLQVEDTLLLHRTSRISTEAGGSGNGGNIDIDSDFIVAVPEENSDIIANAFEGRGGNINITAQGIFGIEFRDRQTPLSDITASSEFGLNGVVEINTPNVDPSRGIAELPTNLVDAQGLLDRRCSVGSETRHDSFTVTGRGGLPSNPGEPLTSDALAVDWVSLDSEVGNNAHLMTTTPSRSAPRPIVEAQGWVVNEQGQVVLVAQAPTVTPQSRWLDPAQCNTPRTSSTP